MRFGTAVSLLPVSNIQLNSNQNNNTVMPSTTISTLKQDLYPTINDKHTAI
jgi:hypothetical protein